MKDTKVGRTKKYKNAEKMQEAIDQYFEDCKGTPLLDREGRPVINKYGYPVIRDRRVPTVTGLAYALGFKSRQTLLNYQGESEFIDTITRAKLRVEAAVNEQAFTRDGARGAEFTLRCNFGWREDENVSDDAALERVREILGGVQSAF